MKIVLLGYMGSGKSTVGRILARDLDQPFLDLDSYIETQLQASIPQIFKEKGELFFRKKEHEYLKEILADPADAVLALGGGTPCYSGNMDAVLNHTPHVFYLMLPIGVLVERLTREKADRPLVRDIPDEELPEFVGKHLFERRPFYAQATHTIAAGERDARQLVAEIKTLLV